MICGSPFSCPLRRIMSISPDHAAEILDAISRALPDVLEQAMDIALHQSLQAAPLVRELESHGYRVDAQFTYSLTATPMEKIFEQSLNGDDVRFLRGSDGIRTETLDRGEEKGPSENLPLP